MTLRQARSSALLLLALAACGGSSGSTSTGDSGSRTPDSSTHPSHDGGRDSGADSGHRDSGSDAKSTDDDAKGGSDAGGDSECEIIDGGHSAPLTFNEGCGQPVTAFEVLWGHVDGGPYPNTIDAGFSCDASACVDGGADADPQLFCSYTLRGLATGNWCITTEACNSAGCSGPANQACVSVPLTCP